MANLKDKLPENAKLIAKHKRARFEYTIEETVEAGLSLLGSEVKSLRDGTANLTDAYAAPKGHELFLFNTRIGPYNPANVFGHEPQRVRKLLLHRNELERWVMKVRERGYSIVPLMLYFKAGIAKVQLALVTGKTHEDRRQDIKERESQREMDRVSRRR